MNDLIGSLVSIADRRRLADYSNDQVLPDRSPEFEQRRIEWFIDLDSTGQVIGASPTVRGYEVQEQETDFKPQRGKRFSAPRLYWLKQPNQSTPATLLVGEFADWFPKDKVKKPEDGPKLWHRVLALSTSDALKGNRFVRTLRRFIDTCPTRAEVESRLSKPRPPTSERISFRVEGRVLLAMPDVQRWWRDVHRAERESFVQAMPEGSDFFQSGQGRITNAFPLVFGKMPLASFDKAPFSSFGLSGGTARMRIDTAEKAAAALTDLSAKRVSSFSIGDSRFLFWAEGEVEAAEVQMATSFVSLLEMPDPLFVRDYLAGVFGGGQPDDLTGKFQCVVLSAPQGRFVIRSWHTSALPATRDALKRWHEATRLGRYDVKCPRMRDLALSLLPPRRGGKTVEPRASDYEPLISTALFGMSPLPSKILARAVDRQCAEMASANEKNFDWRLRARTMIVKAYFAYAKGAESIMNEDTHLNLRNRAYMYGRLLAMLSRIHGQAHQGKSASDPGSRFYTSASRTPALVFPRLCQLAQYHLQKMGSAEAARLRDGIPDRLMGLSQIGGALKDVPPYGTFERYLSLEDQGRFAIGYYYERALEFEWRVALGKKAIPEAETTEEQEESVDANTSDRTEEGNE